jgi:hypothetical protein
VTEVVLMAAVLRCGKQMENFHIITFLGQSFSKSRDKCEMLPLETEQSGGELLPLFGSPKGSVSGGNSRVNELLQEGLQTEAERNTSTRLELGT